MSTFQDLQDRVNRTINRTDYSSDVAASIQQAIRYYERRRWQFNETISNLAAIAGSGSIALPANFLVLDMLKIVSNGSTDELNRESIQYIHEMRDNATSGLPTHFTIYRNKFELAVVPDSAYVIPCYYLKSLTALSVSSDSNAWTDGIMQDLIVARANHLMWSDFIRNDKETLKWQQREAECLTLATEGLNQFTYNRLEATKF